MLLKLLQLQVERLQAPLATVKLLAPSFS